MQVYSPICIHEDAWSLGHTISFCSGPGVSSLSLIAKYTMPGQFLTSQQKGKVCPAARGPGDLCVWASPGLLIPDFNCVHAALCTVTPETAPSILVPEHWLPRAAQSSSPDFCDGDHTHQSPSEHTGDMLGSAASPETGDFSLLYILQRIWQPSLNVVSFSSFLLHPPKLFPDARWPSGFPPAASSHPYLGQWLPLWCFWVMLPLSHSSVSSALSNLLFSPQIVF